MFATVEQVKDMKILDIPIDTSPSAKQALKAYNEEININIPANDQTPKIYLDKITKCGAFLKRKGIKE